MARRKQPTETVTLTLRLPEALRQTLTNEAEKANRSLNSEILWRVGQTFGEQWQRFIAGVEEQEKSEQERIEQLMQNPKLREAVAKLVATLPKKEGK